MVGSYSLLITDTLTQCVPGDFTTIPILKTSFLVINCLGFRFCRKSIPAETESFIITGKSIDNWRDVHRKRDNGKNTGEGKVEK